MFVRFSRNILKNTRRYQTKVPIEKVKELRQITLSPLGKCKQALEESDGDIEKAKEWLRKKGIQTANIKGERNTSQGLVGMKIENNIGVLVELNSETDFVARREEFQNILNSMVNEFSKGNISKDDLKEKYSSEIQNLISKVGENIMIGKVEKIESSKNEKLYGYVHNELSKNLGTICSMVSILNNEESAKIGQDLCMQITAMEPKYLEIKDVPNEDIEKEKEILMEEIKNKMADRVSVADKIIEGRLKKYYNQIVLYEQPWILDNKKSVANVVGKIISSFKRVKIGE
eukprot:gene5062-8662_t